MHLGNGNHRDAQMREEAILRNGRQPRQDNMRERHA